MPTAALCPRGWRQEGINRISCSLRLINKFISSGSKNVTVTSNEKWGGDVVKSKMHIFKIKNRKGYAAICCDHLTEGKTAAQAAARMEKALRRRKKTA